MQPPLKLFILQVTWRWQPFNNPARTDNLALEHWVKCYKDQSGNIRPADEGEYSFAKFNKKVLSWPDVVITEPSTVLSSIDGATDIGTKTAVSYMFSQARSQQPAAVTPGAVLYHRVKWRPVAVAQWLRLCALISGAGIQI